MYSSWRLSTEICALTYFVADSVFSCGYTPGVWAFSCAPPHTHTGSALGVLF